MEAIPARPVRTEFGWSLDRDVAKPRRSLAGKRERIKGFNYPLVSSVKFESIINLHAQFRYCQRP